MVVYKFQWVLVILLLLLTENLSQLVNEEEIQDRVKRSHEGNIPTSSRPPLDNNNQAKFKKLNPLNVQLQNVGLIPLARQLEDKLLLPSTINTGNPKISLRLDPSALLKSKDKPVKNIAASPTSGNFPVHFYMLDKKNPIKGPNGLNLDQKRSMEENPKPVNTKSLNPVPKQIKNLDKVISETSDPVPPSVPKRKQPNEHNNSNLQNKPKEIHISKVNHTLEPTPKKRILNNLKDKAVVDINANKTENLSTVQINVTSKISDENPSDPVGLNSTDIDKKDDDHDITVIAVLESPDKTEGHETNGTIPEYRSVKDKCDKNNDNLFQLKTNEDQKGRTVVDNPTMPRVNAPNSEIDNIKPPGNSANTNDYLYHENINNDFINERNDFLNSDCSCPRPPDVYPIENKINVPDQYTEQQQTIRQIYNDRKGDFRNLPGPPNKQKTVEEKGCNENIVNFEYDENTQKDDNDRISSVSRNFKIGTNNKPGYFNVNLSCREIRTPYQGYRYYMRQPLIAWYGYYMNQNMRMVTPYYLYYYPSYYY